MINYLIVLFCAEFRPPLPSRLGAEGSPSGAHHQPPHPPPQRPLPPPPGPAEPLRRDDGRKPSTPPNRDSRGDLQQQQQRNSRILQQQQQQRKPEDLDVLAAQLEKLASSPNSRRPQQRQHSANGGKISQAPLVEDDSSDEDDEEGVNPRDGTLQVNDPVPKPLKELRRTGGGPGRPLPPTPDDDGSREQGDTMRRAGSSQMHRMDSSPGLQHQGGRVMPDLLPPQSTSGPNTPVSRMSAAEDPHRASPHSQSGMNEKQKSFLLYGFSAEAQATRRHAGGGRLVSRRRGEKRISVPLGERDPNFRARHDPGHPRDQEVQEAVQLGDPLRRPVGG